MSLPNLITVFRLLAVPAVIYALLHGYLDAAFWLFTVAGVSDGVDGALARFLDQRTELGAWLDPIADKLLMVSVFVMLAWMDAIPDWVVFLIVTRDVLIVAIVLISGLAGSPMKVSPIFISKANTAVQILLAFAVLGNLAFDMGIERPIFVLVIVVALLTIASGAAYLMRWMRQIAGASGNR